MSKPLEPKLVAILVKLGQDAEDALIATEIHHEFVLAWDPPVRGSDVYRSEFLDLKLEMRKLLPVNSKVKELLLDELQILYDHLPPSPLRETAGILAERIKTRNDPPKTGDVLP